MTAKPFKSDIRKPPIGVAAFVRPDGWREAMKLLVYPLALLFAGGLVFGAAMLTSGEASAQQEAVTGTISGEAIQKVGFRAMIQKQAIIYDLSGYARNVPDGTVSISLQGDKDRIEETSRRSALAAKNRRETTSSMLRPRALDPTLKTFTVYGWTSTSRNIANPYDLVFRLRPANDEITKKEAAAVWNTIAESTLKGDDLAKFMQHLDSDD